MNELKLTLKKIHFDNIFADIKKEEYREIKPYWDARLLKYIKQTDPGIPTLPLPKRVRFYNGHCASEKYPNFTIELTGLKKGLGRSDWGAELGVSYYILSLGKILSHSNIKTLEP